MDILVSIITSLYAITGTIGLIAYLPTIKDLVKNIPSANVNSYALWSFTGFISFLYSSIVIGDLLLLIVAGLHFLACATILVLSLRVKHNSKKMYGEKFVRAQSV